MMDWAARLDELLAVAERLGVRVRAEALGGEGGGLCRIRDHTVLFVDTMADLATRYQRTLEALADLPGLDDQYLRPDVREQIEHLRSE